jgi:hypothetical protein
MEKKSSSPIITRPLIETKMVPISAGMSTYLRGNTSINIPQVTKVSSARGGIFLIVAV